MIHTTYFYKNIKHHKRVMQGVRIQGPLVRATKAKYENSVELWGLIYECVKAIRPFTSLYILRQQAHNELRTNKSLPLALLNIQHGLDS
jgi:hypothetical protein